MNLVDGFEYYKADAEWWQFTLQIEDSAGQVVKLIELHGGQPTPSALAAAHALLVVIEKWKAMCLGQRMGNAEQNSQRDVWNAFHGALNARTDVDAVLSIMQLKGFGSYRDEESGQRRAKVATAALRFLRPDSWGVVDWRTAAMLGYLDKTHGDVEEALRLATKENANDLRDVFDIIDENGACAVNHMYRERQSAPCLPRAADVDMAVFGLSMKAWPFAKSTYV